MERTIRVTGRGKMNVKPDTIELNIFVSKVYPEYAEAMEASAEMTEVLKAAAERAGFDPRDLKTTGFSINMNYEGVYDEKGNWKNKFAGYRYDHNLALRFDADNVKLGKMLWELSDCGADAEISINHTVKDPEPVRNELLAKAVKDSRTKAEVLAAASGVSLGDIISVDYSWGEMQIFNRTVDNLTFGSNSKISMTEESFGMDIEADDIHIRDTVTVIWEIR
ncbi:MAG: SIMPL domain-containing protein [Firmicutes bacterium]|nr:SIMPL domain-containing protein [Bacillota bacterium]MBR3260355.1 SIMPL domain-containing protein [Bacillota bacterium]MBR6224491.1 SIMPL domain-containing protein [Bacillota bacterium]